MYKMLSLNNNPSGIFQVSGALVLLVLPGMVLAWTVLVFPDPLEDAKAPVPLGEAVHLPR